MQGLIEDLRDEGLDQEAADQVGDLSHLPQHQADQGSETFEREKDIAILEQLERELAEIEAALQRLDDGTYGIDEVTGEPIAPERLEAYPDRATNVDSVDTASTDLALTVTLRLFAAAREAAGRGRDEYDRRRRADGGCAARRRDRRVRRRRSRRCSRRARVWVNGDEPADGRATRLADGDEVAVLPPVSGG